MNKSEILGCGAEAILTLENNQVTKNRISKSYRLPQIDEQIRKLRTRNEAKLLEKAGKIIPTPKVISSDEKTKEIILEFIDGKKLSECLNEFSLKEQEEICKQIGQSVAKLHDAEIIHGDLTTSNMIYVLEKNLDYQQQKDNGSGERKIQSKKLGGKVDNANFKIFFIDFGLSFNSPKFEDKAVDLHLLKQALEAKHFQHWETLFKKVLEGYSISKNSDVVLKQFKEVEKRGRYKEH